MKISLVQADIFWEEVNTNLKYFEEQLSDLKDRTDLIVLPELFSTGFSMNTALLAEKMEGRTMKWMARLSRRLNCSITGSCIIKENGNYYNRLIWMKSNGQYDFYDKRHLFRMSEERDIYTAGKQRLIVNDAGFRVLPLICYDLRFPVWSRNRMDYDLLIYVANWPGIRRDVWLSLLKARAIENHCFVAGANRVGRDGMMISYTGDSVLFDYKGLQIAGIPAGKAGIISSEISLRDLLEFRKKFPVHLDADDFEVIN